MEGKLKNAPTSTDGPGRAAESLDVRTLTIPKLFVREAQSKGDKVVLREKEFTDEHDYHLHGL